MIVIYKIDSKEMKNQNDGLVAKPVMIEASIIVIHPSHVSGRMWVRMIYYINTYIIEFDIEVCIQR